MVKKLPYAHSFWDMPEGDLCDNCGFDEPTHAQMPSPPTPEPATAKAADQSFLVDGKVYYVVPVLWPESVWCYEVRTAKGKVYNPAWPFEEYTLAQLIERVRVWR